MLTGKCGGNLVQDPEGSTARRVETTSNIFGVNTAQRSNVPQD